MSSLNLLFGIIIAFTIVVFIMVISKRRRSIPKKTIVLLILLSVAIWRRGEIAREWRFFWAETPSFYTMPASNNNIKIITIQIGPKWSDWIKTPQGWTKFDLLISNPKGCFVERKNWDGTGSTFQDDRVWRGERVVRNANFKLRTTNGTKCTVAITFERL